MNTISAIETAYKGYRFRSRLEARWAMFFDLTGVPWVYEPECLKVDGEAYLPDFLLWGDTHHEVKSRHESTRVSPPRVYLAGKMKAAHEWRGEAAVCEEGNREGSAPDLEWWDAERLARMDGATFWHVGPFSISDDHRGGHYESAVHMAASCVSGTSEQQVLAACRAAIEGCDIFCAHLNTADAFGTLVEIGYAAALRKKVAVTISEGVAEGSRRPDHWGGHSEEKGQHDFWFAQLIADKGGITADDSEARKIHAAFIAQNTPREYRLISALGAVTKKAVMTFGDPLDLATHGEAHNFGVSLTPHCIEHMAAAEAVRRHRFDAR